MNSKIAVQTIVLVAVISVLGLVVPGAQAQVTGFNQTRAGPHDYTNTANWVGGVVNGIWDGSLALAIAQTNTFSSDTTLTTGLNIGHTGAFAMTLRSDGVADRTLTLGGNITVGPTSAVSVTIGSATASHGLKLNLGGVDRTFFVGTSRNLLILNALTNGNISVVSTNPAGAGGIVRLSGAAGAAANSDITVSLQGNLEFNSSATAFTGSARARNVTLKHTGKLIATGQNGVNTTDPITGNLTIDGAGFRTTAGLNMTMVTVDAGTKNELLSITDLLRASNGTAFFRGDNLGVNTIASATASSANLQITGTAPTLVGGGGAAASTTISIIPWAVGALPATAAGPLTFVTYTAANGIRPLDTTTEYAGAFGGSASDNVRLTAVTDTGIAIDTTVNSLILAGAGGTISGPGKLTVTSGAVMMTRTTGASSAINTTLNFGAAEGIFHYVRGDSVNAIIEGSGGLTVNGNRSDEGLLFTNLATCALSTYTGDTTVLANMQVVSGMLPSGARTGDVYVYGTLVLWVGSFNGTINGLFGNGRLSYGNSGASSIAIGDNNATSTFTGTIAGNANLSVSKIGTGTLTLTGSNTNSKVMSILGGTLAVTYLANGGTVSGIGSSASTAGNLIINGGILKYIGAVTSSDRLFQVGVSTTGGTATLDASGSGAVNFSNGGSLTYGTAGTAGTPQTRNLVLTGSNTGSNILTAVIANNGVAVNGNSDVSLTKTGAGTWIISGANTYLGSTAVSNGTLLVNGSLGAGGAAVSVSGGALGGTGTIARAVSVDSTGILAPGTDGSIGTLTVTGNVTFGAGAQLNVDVDALDTDTDLLAASGSVTGGPVQVNVTTTGPGPWKIMTAASITATFTTTATDLVVKKANGDTELWLARGQGTLIFLQ